MHELELASIWVLPYESEESAVAVTAAAAGLGAEHSSHTGAWAFSLMNVQL